MDRRTLFIIDATGDILCYNKKSFLFINTKVRASMKDDQYTTNACFSGGELTVSEG